MRHKSEATMEKIIKETERFYFTHRRSPSITELADAVGCARSTAHEYLRGAADGGGKLRGEEIIKNIEESVMSHLWNKREWEKYYLHSTVRKGLRIRYSAELDQEVKESVKNLYHGLGKNMILPLELRYM